MFYLFGYVLIVNQLLVGFGGVFFFSVEMFVIVGYGDMYLQMVYVYFVVMFEIFVGMLGIVLVIGFVFVWFLWLQVKILFVCYVIVWLLNGWMMLMVCVVNVCQNVIVEVQVKLWLMCVEGMYEGYLLCKIYDLLFVCSEYLIFLFGWNLMYVIDELSVLFGEMFELFVVCDV